MTDLELGRIAQAAYCKAANVKPAWDNLNCDIQQMWVNVAQAVIATGGWEEVCEKHRRGDRWMVYGKRTDGTPYMDFSEVFVNQGKLNGRWSIEFMHGYLSPTHVAPIPAPPTGGENAG